MKTGDSTTKLCGDLNLGTKYIIEDNKPKVRIEVDTRDSIFNDINQKNCEDSIHKLYFYREYKINTRL